jgi:hypothetical protein
MVVVYKPRFSPSNMRTKRIFRVVLASPRDVQSEREEAKSVVDSINDLLRATENPVIIELVRWETDAYPGMHIHGPQGLIDEQLQIEECDAIIGVFWKRYGTPVGASADSGTAHEIRRAIAAWRKKGTPQVMLYFRNLAGAPESSEDAEQRRRVEEFKRHLLGTDAPLVWEYEDPNEFSSLIGQHLPILVGKSIKQPPPVSALQASLTANTLLVRREGHTELMGELLLRCTYDGDIPYQGPRHCDVHLHLSAPITSRIFENGICEITLCETDSMDDGTLIVGTLGLPGTNKVTFPNVPLDIASGGTVRKFQIANVRCDCTVVPISALGAGRVLAYVTMTGLPVENPQQVVAKVTNGLSIAVAVTGTPIPGTIATLNFIENFAGAFKSRASRSSRIRKNTSLGKVSTGESSLFSAILAVGDAGQVAGLADSGTCLQANFEGVSDGLRLFVSVHEHGTDRRARLLGVVSAPGETLIIAGTEVRELCVHNDRAVAVWEVLAVFPSEQKPGCLSFDVIAALAENVIVGAPSAKRITVICGFSPQLPAYSSTAPIPNFSTTVNVATEVDPKGWTNFIIEPDFEPG